MNAQTRIRNKRRWLIAAAVLALPVVALAWWLGSPLFLDTTVDETFPVVDAAPLSIEDDDPSTAKPEPETSETLATETSEPAPEATGPIVLQAGSFMDADDAHRGSGSAAIYKLEDGSHLLRFEEFEVTNGPDLHVLLVPTHEPVNRDLLGEVGYEDLGKLKGNIGDQNYELPAGFDPDGPWTIVIYCDPFHVVFSTAQLSG